MIKTWVLLSTKWQLEEVQAGLNVVLTALGIVGVWTFGRLCRQSVTRRILLHHEVHLPELLTVSGPGAVWDVVALLKQRVFRSPHIFLLAQCIAVIAFTVMTLFSGILAKVSLRNGSRILNSTVSGLIPNAHGTGWMANELTANVVWNLTYKSLDRAGFPLDQLLDFVPDTYVPWMYSPEQWNSTWALKCTTIDRVPIDIGQPNSTAVFPLRDMFGIFPAAKNGFPSQYRDDDGYRFSSSGMGCFDVQKQHLQHAVYYGLYSPDPTTEDRMYSNNQTFDFSLGAIDIEEVPFNDSFTGAPAMSARVIGPPKKAVLSRIDCSAFRTRPVADANYTAWVWTNDTQSLIQAFADYHRWDSISAYLAKDPNYMTSARDLIRFFQVYMINKDTWEFSAPVQRTLSVEFCAIELSIVSLVLLSVIWLAILLGSVRYFIYWVRRRQRLDVIPDSALDWMIHASNLEEDGCQKCLDRSNARKFSKASYQLLPQHERVSKVVCSKVVILEAQPSKEVVPDVEEKIDLEANEKADISEEEELKRTTFEEVHEESIGMELSLVNSANSAM